MPSRDSALLIFTDDYEAFEEGRRTSKIPEGSSPTSLLYDAHFVGEVQEDGVDVKQSRFQPQDFLSLEQTFGTIEAYEENFESVEVVGVSNLIEVSDVGVKSPFKESSV